MRDSNSLQLVTDNMRVALSIVTIMWVYGMLPAWSQCDSPYSCTGIHSTTRFWHCKGASSCRGATMIEGAYIICTGSFACVNISQGVFGANWVECRTLGSCIDSAIKMGDEVECLSQRSCARSSISLVNVTNVTYDGEVYCDGGQSCIQSKIFGAKRIYARANYSLYGSTIYSNGSDVSITLSGNYAALNLTILCENSDVCTINCYDNACSSTQTYIYCNSESNCHLNCNDQDRCPTIEDISLYNANHVVVVLEYDLMNDNDKDYFVDEENDCDDTANDIFCDNSLDSSCYYNSDNTINNNGNICCRGYRACMGAPNWKVGGTDGSILCNGYDGCFGLDDNSSLISVLGSVYCGSNRGCINRIIYAKENVVCGAERACQSTEIYDANTVYCDAYSSCSFADIYGVRRVIIDGERGIIGAVIVSAGSANNLMVELSSYYAGSSGEVVCQSGDYCVIKCNTKTACYGLDFICNGNCISYCGDGGSFGTNCPTITGSGTWEIKTGVDVNLTTPASTLTTNAITTAQATMASTTESQTQSSTIFSTEKEITTSFVRSTTESATQSATQSTTELTTESLTLMNVSSTLTEDVNSNPQNNGIGDINNNLIMIVMIIISIVCVF